MQGPYANETRQIGGKKIYFFSFAIFFENLCVFLCFALEINNDSYCISVNKRNKKDRTIYKFFSNFSCLCHVYVVFMSMFMSVFMSMI